MKGTKRATILAGVGAIALLATQAVFAELIVSFTDKDGNANSICDQTDVTGAGGNPLATACVGFVSGNDSTAMNDWNTFDWETAVDTSNPSYVDPDDYNSAATVGLFGFTDWLGDAATGVAYKCEDCNAAVGDIGLIYNESDGTISADIGALSGLTQFAVILKQQTEYAAYLFESTVDFPLEYSWQGAGNSNTDLSHVTFIYRKGLTPPEGDAPAPGTLFLLAGPLLGFAAWRRRRN